MPDRAAPRSLADWLDFIDSVHPRQVEMGLERVGEVARRLGVSKPAPRSIIVAGTNGKGSTCVATEQLLCAQGLHVGTTLSPHVQRFNERVRLNGGEVDDARLCAALAAVDAARQGVSLTYFEYAALAALYVFREAEVEVAILEVGLGGRLDAFNLVDADLAVVTSIGLDHQDYLGSDVESIGREKAGVFRRGQRVVLGRVSDSVHEAAAALGCPTLSLGTEVIIRERTTSWDYVCDPLALRYRGLPRGPLAPSNCALGMTAAAWLTGAKALAVTALSGATLPGRMERHALAGREVILDVAHNPAGAEFLAEQLEHRFPGRRYVAVLGMLADKDSAGVARAMAPLIRHWVVVPTWGARGQSAESLAAKLDRPAEAAAGMADGLARALSLTASGDGILAFGSFSAVEQARALFNEPPRHD
ncbi:MAG TPA: folylpolyglutamate synthase/dihydrofolate synthase family protein [Pseudomonadales bacterium]